MYLLACYSLAERPYTERPKQRALHHDRAIVKNEYKQ